MSVFITCFNDTLFPPTGRAMVELLERLGHEVEFRPEQTCCGQMHMNSGYRDEGLELAARMRRVFDGAEAIVTPVGARAPATCCEHAPALPVHELSQFLTGVLGVEDVGARYPARVAYHPTCHSLRALRVGDAPLPAAGAVAGLDLVEIGEADQCCGFGGTFAVKNAEVSMAMLEDKLSAIERSGAEACHRGRQLLPDADRRRAVAARLAGAHRCTSPRSWRPREQRQAGRRRVSAGRHVELRNTQLRRNLGHATRTIRAKRAAVVDEVETGSSCARPARRSSAT